MSSVTFTIEGEVNTTITITEVVNADTGQTELRFDVAVDESSGVQADLRGLFFDLADDSIAGDLSVTGADVTGQDFDANSVSNLGRGANMNGHHTRGGNGFDGGVAFGTPGTGRDDIDSTSFILSSSTGDLSLDLLSEMRFGVRLTSVGMEGDREDSLKIVDDAPRFINLPPTANDDGATDDDRIVVESGDSVTIDVLANDTDPDSALDPASLTLTANGTLGTGTVAGGQVDYTADDVGGDTTDDSEKDELSYTVDDDQGATSNEADVSVYVIDPLIETSTDSQNAAANNQTISLSLTTEDRTYNDESEVAVSISFGPLVQTDVNVSFVVDGSGSISALEWTQQMAAVQETIDQLRAQYDGSGTDVEVQLVQFSGDNFVNDPGVEAISATYDLFDTALDSVTTTSVFSPQLNEFTNYEAGFDDALEFFTGQGAQENYLLFISDGQPNRAVNPSDENLGIIESNSNAYLDEVNDIDQLGVSITAVGFGGVSLSTLNDIDNTGGAEVLTDPADLADALTASPLFPADVIEFSLTVNGGSSIADVSDLVAIGGGDLAYTGDLVGLDNSHGATNTVVATAGFDVNNDGVVDEYRTATTIIDGTDGSDIFMF